MKQIITKYLYLATVRLICLLLVLPILFTPLNFVFKGIVLIDAQAADTLSGGISYNYLPSGNSYNDLTNYSWYLPWGGSNRSLYDTALTAALLNLIKQGKIDIKNGQFVFVTVSNKVSLKVPIYRQYNSKWKNVKIGTKTIGQVGCLTTCLAMKYSYHMNTNTTPDKMKQKLRYSNNSLIWSSITKYGYTYTQKYNTKLTQGIMKTIYNQLKNGKPVIIGGKSGTSQHWVIITGYNGNSATSLSSSNFSIIDPGSNKRTTLDAFLKYRSTIQRLIY